MEDGKETNPETPINNATEDVVKPQQPERLDDDNQLQKEQELQKQEQQIEIDTTAIEKQQPELQTIEYQDDDDDDEEKEISQKLVIDIPDDEEEEEKEEEDDDVIALDDLPDELPPKTEIEKVCPKPQIVDAIITLSDGEEDVPPNEAATKPGKVQKRRSMGASSANDEHYRLKRRKINVAGAPKLPLTGYVRYMNDRRESLRKEHPSKTHMEHNKMIGEEWHSLPSEVKSSYLKAADTEKQRLS